MSKPSRRPPPRGTPSRRPPSRRPPSPGHASFARVLLAPLALALTLTLAACGTSAPGDGGGPGPQPGDDPVASSLETLGVNTDTGARRAPDGSELGDDAAPLGASASLGEPAEFSSESAANPTAELIMARNFFASDTLVVEEIVGAAVTPGGDVELGAESELADLSVGNDWAAPVYGDANQFQSLRAVAAGDLDGDGFDEFAALFVDQTDDVLKLKVFEDAAGGFAAQQDALGPGTDVRSLTLVALDGDGDGLDELVAAIAYDDRVDVAPIAASGGGWAFDEAAKLALPQVVTDSTLYVRMATGALDYDNAAELAVVVNEVTGSSSSTTGLATYYLFDDANAGRAELASGLAQATVGATVTAEAADVSLADIDGDGLDEVVLGGATNLAWGCGDEFSALMIALDDAPAGHVQLGAAVDDLFYQNCPAFNSWKRFFVFVATPDLDGDGVHEIAANQLIYDDFQGAAPFTLLDGVELPSDGFLFDNSDVGQYLSVATTDLVAADVTGDGRENLMVYHQNRSTMPVWGISAVSTIGANANGWAVLSEIATPGGHNSQETARPILVPANVDEDGPVLKYGEGSHELVFTEPIVIAALAAPPCHDDIDQNVEACVTSFGQGTSSTVDASLTVTVKASAFVGVESSVNVPFVGEVGAEFQRTVTATASAWAGTAYTVEKTITYSSGPLEDGVVFTTVPYDVYRYEIVSHPDPDMVGNEVVIRLPREPVTMIAERGFYNDAVPAGSLTIGANVFDHVPGDVASYPDASRKNSLVSSFGGLEFGPSGVGQGTGQTNQEIAVSTEVSAGGSLGIEYETTVKATSGVAFAGFSVGYGVEAALSFTSGSQTTFSGTVGSISAADYASNAYSWGIFTYAQQEAGQEFEVINYWVE